MYVQNNLDETYSQLISQKYKNIYNQAHPESIGCKITRSTKTIEA